MRVTLLSPLEIHVDWCCFMSRAIQICRINISKFSGHKKVPCQTSEESLKGHSRALEMWFEKRLKVVNKSQVNEGILVMVFEQTMEKYEVTKGKDHLKFITVVFSSISIVKKDMFLSKYETCFIWSKVCVRLGSRKCVEST